MTHSIYMLSVNDQPFDVKIYESDGEKEITFDGCIISQRKDGEVILTRPNGNIDRLPTDGLVVLVIKK